MPKKQTYKVPVSWVISTTIEVEATSTQQAADFVDEDLMNNPLPPVQFTGDFDHIREPVSHPDSVEVHCDIVEPREG
jgi:hypothetical protein